MPEFTQRFGSESEHDEGAVCGSTCEL